MIIKKLDIESFGKFSGHSFSFDKGFNLIYGNNEDGKTTLMSFIKLMLYGSCGSKSADVSKNLRKKYTPWNKSSMSGAMVFDVNGQTIRMHKEFSKSAATDKTTLFHADTGEKTVSTGAEDVGVKFLGMSSDEFEKSIFIDRFGGFSADASGDSLAMRISNLSSSGDEGYSQGKVRSRLVSAKEKLISKSGRKGLLTEERESLEELLLAYENCREKRKVYEASMSDISKVREEIRNLEAAVNAYEKSLLIKEAEKELSQLTALYDHIWNHKELLSNMKEKGFDCIALKKPVAEAKVLLRAVPDMPDKEFTEITAYDYEQMFKLKERLSQLEKDRDLLKHEITEAFENQKSKTSKIPRLLFILSGLSATSGLVCLLFNRTLSGISLVLFLILLLTSALLQKKLRTSKDTVSFEKALSKLSFFTNDLTKLSLEDIQKIFEKKHMECKSSLFKRLSAYGCADFKEFSQKSSESFALEKLKQDAEIAKKRFTDVISAFTDVHTFHEAMEIFSQLDSTLSTLDSLEHNAQLIASALGIKDLDAEKICERIDYLREQTTGAASSFLPSVDICEIRERLSEKRSELETLQSSLRPPETDERDLEQKISEKRETIARLTEKHEALSLAAEVMDEAITQMNHGLGFQLSKKTGEYLASMSGGKYSEVLVARDLSIEARSSDQEGFREWKYLSSGAIDRAYLALRLAVTDIIASKGNPLPLFLDDILTQYDHESCRNTLVFLKEYLQNSGSVSQIFFFTCHKHIELMAKEIFPETNEIHL